MKSNRVTLRDIAQKTGYTVNTVSRALKHRDDISKTTVKYICTVAEEMGYINDNIASSMRTGRTGTIAVILADITNPLFAILVREIEQLAVNYQYSVYILNTNEDKNTELQAIKNALGKNVDGFLICPCSDCEDNLKYLKKTGKPYVLLGRQVGDHPSVIHNDVKSGYLAVNYLIEHHRRRKIVFINGLRTISCARDRHEGYCRALQEAGIPYREELVFETPTKAGNIGKILRSLREKHLEYDAIFAFSDMFAYEALNELKDLGQQVPKDIAVIGVDNIRKKLFYMPPLDSIGASDKRMSEVALEILMGIINEEETEFPLHTALDVQVYPAE